MRVGADIVSTVAKKPRAAKRASAEPTLAEHISEMRARLQQADRLLSQAWDASEESSTTDVLLQHLIEDLLPDTMMALKAEQLDRGITRKAYDDLFLPLALLDSIVTLNAGEVLHHTLSSAWTQLDEAQTSLDNAGWSRQLPEAPAAAATSEASPTDEPKEHPASMKLPTAVAAVEHGAALIEQAVAVLASGWGETDADFGILALVTSLRPAFAGGADAPTLDECSASLASVVGLLEELLDHRVDVVLHATHTILSAAKAHIDTVNDPRGAGMEPRP